MEARSLTAATAAPSRSQASSRRRPSLGSTRLLIHDYSGHPFQVQLSRELASRGYQVLHLHCPSYRSGKGALERAPGDPATFSIDEIRLAEDFDKYSLWKRPAQERTYARRLIKRAAEFSPHVVISGNTPLVAQRMFLRHWRRRKVPFVFWHQDLYSLPMKQHLQAHVPIVGRPLGRAMTFLEASALRGSDAVISISEDFRPQLRSWRVPDEKLHVVENWAPITELPVLPRRNEWAREHGLAESKVLLYSGTLGIKHDPGLLFDLALAMRDDPVVRVVVISEGAGAESLARAASSAGLDNVTVLEFQPWERVPEVLATAHVLLAILERDAGVFSIPSKVLTYLCAARPVLAAIPRANLATRTIERSRGGVVVDPGDREALVAAARQLLDDSALRDRYGANARAYAEATFGIEQIADRFAKVVQDSLPDRLPLERAQCPPTR